MSRSPAAERLRQRNVRFKAAEVEEEKEEEEEHGKQMSMFMHPFLLHPQSGYGSSLCIQLGILIPYGN